MITILGTIAVLIMGYAATIYPRIFKLIRKSTQKNKWYVLFYLICYFLIFYIVFFAFVHFGAKADLTLITVLIFFFGSIYVLETVDIMYKTLHELFLSNQKIKTYANSLEEMITKRMWDFEHKNKELEVAVGELTDFKKAMLNILEDMSDSEYKLTNALKESDSLTMVSQTIAWAADWNKLVSYITRVIGLNMECEKTVLFLSDAQSKNLIAQYGSYEFTKKEIDDLKIEISNSINGLAFKNNETVFSQNAAGDARVCAKKNIINCQNIITGPISDGKNIIGTICCLNSNKNLSENYVKDFYEKMLKVASVVITNSQLISKIKIKETEEDAILKSIADGLLVVDGNGCIVLINDIAEENFRLSREGVLGRNVKNLLGFDFLENILMDIGSPIDKSKIDQSGKTLELLKENELYYLTDSSINEDVIKIKMQRKLNLTFEFTTELTFSLLISPIISDKGTIIGQVVTMHDITKEILSNQAKDEFLSVTSHELRTPMTAIMGNLKMVLDGEAGTVAEEMKEYLEDSYTGSQRLLALVEDMLDISRLEQGRMQYSMSDFDIRDVAKSVIKTLKSLSDQKKIYLIYKVPTKPLMVRGDQNKIIQILTNLVGNAIKFTDKGNVTISHDIEDDKIITIVKDSGIGISKEDQLKLFKKFSQVNINPRSQRGGTGLGLYICRQYVEAMKGKIWILYSQPQNGTAMAFSLPKTDDK